MISIDKKIPAGKLLRLDFDKEEDIIISLKITGDFFIYPEDAIDDIHKIIIGKKISESKKLIADHIKDKKIVLVGFSISDIYDLLESA